MKIHYNTTNVHDVEWVKKISEDFVSGVIFQELTTTGTWEDIETLTLSPYTAHTTIYKLPVNIIRVKPLKFSKPPEGEEWHNPANLTADQIEVDKGYRLLLKSEIGNKEINHPLFRKCETFRSSWWKGSWGGCDGATYRTKVPLPTKKVVTTYNV